MSKIGKVQKFKVKPSSVEAIQYTGKNGKELVAFAAKHGFLGRAGGGWVKISGLYFGDQTVRRNEILTYNGSEMNIYTRSEFESVHVVGKANELV